MVSMSSSDEAQSAVLFALLNKEATDNKRPILRLERTQLNYRARAWISATLNDWIPEEYHSAVNSNEDAQSKIARACATRHRQVYNDIISGMLQLPMDLPPPFNANGALYMHDQARLANVTIELGEWAWLFCGIPDLATTLLPPHLAQAFNMARLLHDTGLHPFAPYALASVLWFMEFKTRKRLFNAVWQGCNSAAMYLLSPYIGETITVMHIAEGGAEYRVCLSENDGSQIQHYCCDMVDGSVDFTGFVSDMAIISLWGPSPLMWMKRETFSGLMTPGKQGDA